MADETSSPRAPAANPAHAPHQKAPQRAPGDRAGSPDQREAPVHTAAQRERVHTEQLGRLIAAQPGLLVDRVEERESIRSSLGVEDVRLLTLVGPAGVGKTRLALAVAAELVSAFPDGVVWVDLAQMRDPTLVLHTVSRALGVSPVGGAPLLEQLRLALEDRSILLLLDNFEQVLPAASQIMDLLAVCPGIRLLVTSRIPLQLRWEHILRIKPLPVPDLAAPLPLEELAQVPAVALFLDRARARRADFTLTEADARLVAELAVHLDGLPLALELAAARLDTLSLPLLARLLGTHLQLLEWDARDLPERQRSLEAAITWSYELLSAEEQRLFRHVGVFASCVSPTAVAAVLGAPSIPESLLSGLVALAEKSLIVRGQAEDGEGEEDEQGLPVFRLLETLREYAREQLVRAGELDAARRAHAHYFLGLAERADPQLRGREQRAWFMLLERKHDNLRAALRWLLDQNEPAERAAGLRLAVALGYFWRFRGYHAEGARWIEEGLRRAPYGDGAEPAVRMRALVEAGALLAFQGDLGRARKYLEDGLALARQHQDAKTVTQALTFLGMRALYDGQATEAAPVLEEALHGARALGDAQLIGNALYFLGATVQAQGKTAEAAAHYAEALQLAEELGDSRGAATIHIALAALPSQREDQSGRAEVVRHIRAGLAVSVALQDRWLLSLGAQAALVVVGERVDPADRARLQGAVDTLRLATGAGLAAWQQETKDRKASGLQGRDDTPERAAAYREGRTLAMNAVAALAERLGEDAERSRASAGAGSAQDAEQRSPTSGARHENVLTKREQEVLRLVTQGMGNKAIARQLIISPSTVNYHLIQIFNKLVVETRAQAVAVAAQRGLL